MNKLPKINEISEIKIPELKYIQINNKPFYYLVDNRFDLVKGRIVFNAGIKQIGKKLDSILLAQMLTESTKNYSSSKLSEMIDYYGGELNITSLNHYSVLSFTVIKKNYNYFLDLIIEILNNALFKEEELKIKINQFKSRYLINLEDTAYLANNKLLNTILFDTPYGNVINIDDFEQVKRTQLLNCYNRLYVSDDIRMFFSGNIEERIIKITEKLNKIKKSNEQSELVIPLAYKEKDEKIFIKKENAKQTSIRVGKILPPPSHHDFIVLEIIVKILGGYFNSRLMQRMREKDGLTYGVYSYILPFPELSLMIISAEVNSEYRQKALDIIYEEIEKLCTNPVPEKELKLIFLSTVSEYLSFYENPFSSIDSFMNLLELNLPVNFHEILIDRFKNIKPEELTSVANEYLSNNFVEVVVG